MDTSMPKTETVCEVGEDLYGLSLHELDSRIEVYQVEIERLKTEKRKKSAEREAADAIFGSKPS